MFYDFCLFCSYFNLFKFKSIMMRNLTTISLHARNEKQLVLSAFCWKRYKEILQGSINSTFFTQTSFFVMLSPTGANRALQGKPYTSQGPIWTPRCQLGPHRGQIRTYWALCSVIVHSKAKFGLGPTMGQLGSHMGSFQANLGLMQVNIGIMSKYLNNIGHLMARTG